MILIEHLHLLYLEAASEDDGAAKRNVEKVDQMFSQSLGAFMRDLTQQLCQQHDRDIKHTSDTSGISEIKGNEWKDSNHSNQAICIGDPAVACVIVSCPNVHVLGGLSSSSLFSLVQPVSDLVVLDDKEFDEFLFKCNSNIHDANDMMICIEVDKDRQFEKQMAILCIERLRQYREHVNGRLSYFQARYFMFEMMMMLTKSDIEMNG